uniref:post-GPI attachment to proteins factor 3 isoform X1 n=1 Tax=Myxine glutinosa TaxID=7769 RepID=UPI00358F3D4A
MRSRIVGLRLVLGLMLASCDLFSGALGSSGDEQPFYRNCINNCSRRSCFGDALSKFVARQPLYMRLSGWNCVEECRYGCMWRTVDLLQEAGYDIPQFHGKWPFVRWLCVQEPLSAIFSALNGFSYLFMARRYCASVPSTAPTYTTVVKFSAVAVLAWCFSFAYHCKDTPLTEKMDYFGATSLLLYSVYFCCVRTLGLQNPWVAKYFGYLLLIAFGLHILYMSYVCFDYGYNMLLSIAIGMLNLVWWSGWCVVTLGTRPYVWRCLLTMFCLHGAFLLELFDFPPLLWALDAHALWHLSTAPIPLLFYGFLIEDSRSLLREEELHKFL